MRQSGQFRIDPSREVELPAKKSLREAGVIRFLPCPKPSEVKPAVAGEEGIGGEDDEDGEPPNDSAIRHLPSTQASVEGQRQLMTVSPSNRLKSTSLNVTNVSSFTNAMAAICPS